MDETELRRRVDLMEQVWSSLGSLLGGLGTRDWKRGTDCPGWTVKDIVAHMAGNESTMLGRPRPDLEPPDKPWIENEPGQVNEIEVEGRRKWPAEQVLAEWRDVTQERLNVLRSFSGADWEKTAQSPMGETSQGEALRFRIFDAWIHEQDIRRAVGEPGHLEGPVARFCFEMMVGAMPYVVGKKAEAPDGATVIFDLQDGPAQPFAIGMEGKRAKGIDPPEDPTVELAMGWETFAALCAGRWAADEMVKKGKVTIYGDPQIGARVVAHMGFVP